MVGGTSKNCEVFDSFSQKFASIKPILPIYRYEHVRTQYAVIGSKIKIFNNDSLDAIVFDTEKEEWLEEISEEQFEEFSVEKAMPWETLNVLLDKFKICYSSC